MARQFKRRASKVVKKAAPVELPGVGLCGLHKAAELLDLDERTLRNKSATGEWPGRKVAGRWKFPWEWVRQMTGQSG